MYELGARLARQGGRRAVHRLRPRRHLDRRHACRRCAAIASSIRWSSPANATSPRMSISPRWRAARAPPARRCYGPIDQGDFLREIGIDTRAQALSDRTPDRAEEFEQARRRLVGKDVGEMGGLFKAMVVANRDLPAPPGFETRQMTAPLARRSARPARRAPRLLHAARAASRRASTPRSTAASAPRTRPRPSRRTAPAWRRRSGSAPERLLVPYQVHSPDVVDRLARPGRRRRGRAATASSPRRRGWRSASPAPIAA